MKFLPDRTLGQWIEFVGYAITNIGTACVALLLAGATPSVGLAVFAFGVGLALVFLGSFVHHLRAPKPPVAQDTRTL